MAWANVGGTVSNQYASRPTTERPRVDIDTALVAAAFTSHDGLSAWQAWGATDEEIGRWAAVDVGSCEAAWCTAYGITPGDVPGYRTVGLVFGTDTTGMWARPTFLPWLSRRGVTGDEIEAWHDALTSGPEAHQLNGSWGRWLGWGVFAAAFRDAGWDPYDAAPWIHARYCSPTEVPSTAAERARLLRSPQTAVAALETRWRETGSPFDPCKSVSYQVASQRGVPRSGVYEWRAWGMTDPVAATAWFSHIEDKSFATYWHRNGVPLGYASEAWQAWKECHVGFSDPRLIESWWQQGLDPRQEAGRVKDEITDGAWDGVHKIDGWVFEQIDPVTARAWTATCPEHPREAVAWMNAGYGPDDVCDWQTEAKQFGVQMSIPTSHPFKPVMYLCRDRHVSPKDMRTVMRQLDERLGT